MKVEEALACNLVDEVHEMEDLLPQAEQEMQRLLRLSDNLLQQTKLNMRAELIGKLGKLLQNDTKPMVEAWFNPQSRAIMKMLVDSISKK